MSQSILFINRSRYGCTSNHQPTDKGNQNKSLHLKILEIRNRLSQASNPVVIGRKAVGSQILGLGVGNGEEGQMLVAKMPKALRILETASPWEIERQKAPGQNF